MAKKPLNKKQLKFVKLVAQGMNQAEAYVSTIAIKDTTEFNARAQASKTAKKYAKQIAAERRIAKRIQDTAEEKAIVKTAERRILSKADRMEILTDMASGRLKVTKVSVVAGQLVEHEVHADFSERRGALTELNKMTGDYEPVKTEVEVTGGENSEIMDFLTMRKNASKT